MANNDFSTLGGAYSILGQATTAEYNRRKKEERDHRRKMRRQQILQYLAAPLLKSAGESIAGAVTKPFEDKYNDFFNTEEATAAFAKEQKALRNAEGAYNRSKMIQDYGIGTHGGWYQDQAVNKGRTDLISLGRNKDLVASGIYDPFILERAEPEIEKQRANLEETLALADRFKSGRSVKDQLKLLNKRDRNVFQALFSKAKGETTAEQDEKAMQSFRKSLASQNREALASFDASKALGGSNLEAMFSVEQDFGKLDEIRDLTNKPFQRETSRMSLSAEGIMIQTKTTEYFDPKRIPWKPGSTPIAYKRVDSEPIEIKDSKVGMALQEKSILGKLQRSFNYSTSARAFFSEKGMVEFGKRLEAKASTDFKDSKFGFGFIDTLEKREAIGLTFNEMIKEGKWAKPSSNQTAMQNKIATLLVSDSNISHYRKIMDTFPEGTPDHTKARENYFKRSNEIVELTERAFSTSTSSDTSLEDLQEAAKGSATVDPEEPVDEEDVTAQEQIAMDAANVGDMVSIGGTYYRKKESDTMGPLGTPIYEWDDGI